MKITKIQSGSKCTLYGLVINSKCLIFDFIEGLDEKDQKQTLALLKFVCEAGPPKNTEKFKNIGDRLYELKTRGGVRILSFFAGPSLRNALILTHGFKKSGRRIFVRQREKAAGWLKEFSDIDDIKKILIVMEI